MGSSKSSNPYIGSIKIIAWSVTQLGGLPSGWMLCQGQQMSVSAYKDLFNLLGTTYGGDGKNTFNLPNLQCYAPFGTGTLNQGGSTINLGQTGGTSATILSQGNIPSHTHLANVTQPSTTIKVSSANASQSSPTSGCSIATPGSQPARSFVATLGFNTSTPSTLFCLANTSITLGPVTVQNQPQGVQVPMPFSTQPPFLGLNFMICVE